MVAASVDEERVAATMRSVWNDGGVLIDPHTAVGVAAAAQFAAADRVRGERLVCISTAHPGKFIERVAAATGLSEADVAADLRRSCPQSANVERAIQLHTQQAHSEYSTLWDRECDWESALRRVIEKRSLQVSAQCNASHIAGKAAGE